ncbi:MAG: hydrogenase maturation protease [Prochlorococcaceae cyanobacterium]
MSGGGDGAAALVIGIGNPLRGDDGVGWWLARRARRLRPAPAVRLVQQATPELAAEVAAARRLLVVDAWHPVAPGAEAGPCLRPLVAAAAGSASSHGLAAAELVAVARLLWPRTRVEGWELLVPAACFHHGPGLSPELRRWLPRAEALLRQWGATGGISGDA